MSEITLLGHDVKRLPIAFLGSYSDGTPMVKEDFDPLDIHSIVVRQSSLNDFVTAMFLVDSINYRGGKVKNLIVPFLPGARQDRINPTGDVLFTALSVARMINQRSFSRVITLDPHSDVMPNMIYNVEVFPLSEIAESVWQGYTGIIAPDKGAKLRAEEFAAAMGKPIYYASKNRDVSTGRLSGFEVSVPFGHYLVVDDICDGGGTFIGLGEKIREQGAYADLYVTHGIFAKGTSALHEYYKNIYTTDSRIVHERNRVNTIKILERMIENV